MKEKFNKLFLNDKLFYSMPWVCLLSVVAYAAWLLLYRSYIKTIFWNGVMILTVVICLFVIVNSYRKHNKNLMKAMSGFIFAVLLYKNMYDVLYMTAGSLSSVFKIAILVLTALIIVHHFALANDHHSRPMTSFLNQVFMVLTILISIIGIVVRIINASNAIGEMFDMVVYALYALPVEIAVICIEARVNDFKIKREANGYVVAR